MAASFSFSFGGEDIDDEDNSATAASQNDRLKSPALEAGAPGAFPVPGKPQLPPLLHHLPDMLAQLPSKIAFGTLPVSLDDASVIELPRRELWDVRVQLMAEDEERDGTGDGAAAATDGDDDNGPPEGLGSHDVKTGVYEGGFKSWESSVDLVKVLGGEGYLRRAEQRTRRLRVVELGCGTALPSLSLFRAAASAAAERGEGPPESPTPISLILADYNPTVMQLVTLPNFILTWALAFRGTARSNCPGLDEAFELGDELELTPDVITAFQDFLTSNAISLRFVSGGWCPELVELLVGKDNGRSSAGGSDTLILGAETIYSPFALEAFNETIFRMFLRERERDEEAGDYSCEALVAAKKLYFGVGGSLDDFVERARGRGAVVTQLREETEGVRRGVVRCVLP